MGWNAQRICTAPKGFHNNQDLQANGQLIEMCWNALSKLREIENVIEVIEGDSVIIPEWLRPHGGCEEGIYQRCMDHSEQLSLPL